MKCSDDCTILDTKEFSVSSDNPMEEFRLSAFVVSILPLSNASSLLVLVKFLLCASGWRLVLQKSRDYGNIRFGESLMSMDGVFPEDAKESPNPQQRVVKCLS